MTLASLHAAKGLEWDAVFVVGATEGMIPITYAETPEQVEEERRLLYVGVTRAREHLSITWSLARAPGGRASRRPSRFLDGMHASSSQPAGGPRRPRAQGPRDLPGLRQGAHGTGRPQARALRGLPARRTTRTLFERLREWRAEQAREASVPAYVVFTDATLTALAEVRPTTEPALLGISGIGRTKLERYGADVLALCAGDPVAPGGPKMTIRESRRQESKK